MKTTKGISSTTGVPFSIEEREDLCSVEVNINAKGDTTVSVKVYAQTANEASEEAVKVLTDTIAKLTEQGNHVAGV